jgi:hypothetical protein
MFIDYYEILGIESTATDEQVKKAYRINAIKYHPDKNFGDPFFTKKFQEIKEAYDNLSNEDSRANFDILYYAKYGYKTTVNDYTQPNTYGQEQRERDERRKTQKQEEEKFRYDPHKQFYSPFDREQQDTPQFPPPYNLWGEKLHEKLEFFKLPKHIGKIIIGFSDLIQEAKSATSWQKIKGNLIALIIGVAIGTIIYFLAKLENPVWIGIWFLVPSLLLLRMSTSANKFKHTNFYVGVNGFAQFTCEDTRDNLIVNTEVNFNDMTDFYVHNTEVNRNYVYQYTNFIYVCLNRKPGNVIFARDGQFNKKTEIKQQGGLLNFYRAIERYWTVYLLDRLEHDLQQSGHIVFSLYSHKKNACQEYIKLGIGFITFIKSEGQEFTYKFNEIKKMYTKNNELRIQHKNFERTLYFFKSGNEDVIPLLNLCNRQFFYRAIEILLGYSIA